MYLYPSRELYRFLETTMAKSKAARVIYWHRTDLRLHDSPALHAALDLKPECLWQIWTWDSHYVYRAR